MDEATSALDVAVEGVCLQKCVDLKIGMISVAHRPTVFKYHNMKLQLDGKQRYSVEKI